MLHNIGRLFFTLVVVSFLIRTFADGANARVITLADLRREVTLSDPEISPDGSTIALLVERSDFATDTTPVQLVMVNVRNATAGAVKLPFSDIEQEQWSPRGNRIAFIAATGQEPRQLYVAAADGSGMRKLTSGKRSVREFLWRPDGAAIAFLTADSSPERKGTAKFNTSFVVGDNDYLTTQPPVPQHLWLAFLNGAPAKRLTSGSWSIPSELILPQHFPNQFFCWYADGRSIAYTKAPDAYISHADKSVMTVRDLATGHEQALTARAGLEAGCDTSPDGREIAYWYPREGKGMNASSIYVTPSDRRNQNGVDATVNLDRSPWQVRWMPGSKSLLMLAHDRTREGVWVVGVSGSVRRLDIGDLNASAASVSNSGAIAFVASGPRRASELYVKSSASASPRQLTSYNAFFNALQLGAVSHIDWNNDGFAEDGVLTYPPGFVAGKKYPLVLQIHGWPQYASQEAFDTDYPGLTQLFAAHGYVVFEPNYRGSDNMGNAFESAIVGDSAPGPGTDIMAGIAAVEKLGVVDESKIAVTGWSYGGLMTVWLIGHHQFAAAVAGAAPTDLPVDYAIGNYNVLDRHFYGRSLWDSRLAQAIYVDQSPITYAWLINTPTLIMSCIYDTTVPVTHAYELFHALRDRGVPVEFVAYPSSEHYPSDPVLSEDIYKRWVGWLDRYLRLP